MIASVEGMALIGVNREVVKVGGDAMASDEDTSLPWSSTGRRTEVMLNGLGVAGVQRVWIT